MRITWPRLFLIGLLLMPPNVIPASTAIVTSKPTPADVVMVRPLDWQITLPPGVPMGQEFTFTHELGPFANDMHPVRLYSHDYQVLWGLGQAAVPSSQQLSKGEFGDGRDGDLIVEAGQTHFSNAVRANVAITVSAGQITLPVTSLSGLGIGDTLMIHQSRGVNLGTWELVSIAGLNSVVTLTHPISFNYSVSGKSSTQVLRIHEYENCIIESGGTLTTHAWNGLNGGIVALRCSGVLQVNGAVAVSGLGLPQTDKGPLGSDPVPGQDTSGTAGGSGHGVDGGRAGGGGGGGGSAAVGSSGTAGVGGGDGGGAGGSGGSIGGASDLSTMSLGGGGGQGGAAFSQCGTNVWHSPESAGRGGGIVFLAARQLEVSQGTILSRGSNGTANGANNPAGGNGGGAGGSVFLRAGQLALAADSIDVSGGSGSLGNTYCNGLDGGNGGAGSSGRIRLEYCDGLLGVANPAASSQKRDCYVTHQVSGSPDATAAIIVPEPITTTRDYQVQFGHRIDFSISGVKTATLRIPAGMYSLVTLETMVVDAASGSFTFALDVGTDGTWDWTTTQAVTQSVTLASPDLAAAFNDYRATQASSFTGFVDVPVAVSVSRAARVLLTGLLVALIADESSYQLFLPTISKQLPPTFTGPAEVEPNNTLAQANGPLQSGVNYFGYQNDTDDFFRFYSGGGNITVSLASASGQGTQLQLFYQSTDNFVGFAGGAPYAINHNGPAGWYYVRVYTAGGFNSSTPYTLQVTYP